MDLDTQGKLVGATGETREPRPAGAEGTARGGLEDGQVPGVFLAPCNAGHTGPVHLA